MWGRLRFIQSLLAVYVHVHKTEKFASYSIKLFFVYPFWLQILFSKWSNKCVSKHAQCTRNRQHAHTCTQTCTHSHKFSHSTEPFLKPGLIFVWIIGLCAYRLHHIGGLKPYYQPIEWEKRFSTSTHSHALASRFHKDTQTFVQHTTKAHIFKLKYTSPW